MSRDERAAQSQAEAWLTKLIQKKLDAGDEPFAYENELEAEYEREFGYPRGPCKPRSPRR